MKSPAAVVSSPAVQSGGPAAFDSPVLLDSLLPFLDAGAPPSAPHLLLLLLPPQRHGHSDGRLSFLAGIVQRVGAGEPSQVSRLVKVQVTSTMTGRRSVRP